MYARDLQPKLTELASQYPVVMLSGPRQSGKTTLAKTAFADKPYFNLEAPDIRASLAADPRRFFEQQSAGAILDEVQRLPELCSYIQTIVDETQLPGQFILTGSAQLPLQASVSQSLAGRVCLLDLLPLSLHELQNSNTSLSLDEYLLKGFYPSVHYKALDPSTAYRNYVKTYVERDIRQLINVQNLNDFQRFLLLAAGRVAQILNVESLANDVGVSHNTIKNWLSVLDASYLSFRLQPYFENFGKRIIKSPKLYFNDVGIVSYLLGIETTEQIQRDRLRGCLFENLVLLELIKTRINSGKEPNIYYYRDSQGHEVDIIIRQGDTLIPIEVKSTATFQPSLLDNLKFFQQLVGVHRAPTGFLIYAGDLEQTVQGFQVISFRRAHEVIDK